MAAASTRHIEPLLPSGATASAPDNRLALPLTGLGLPGYPSLAPPIGPTYGPDSSTFSVNTPLPLPRFFNPLFLAGLQVYAFPQPLLPQVAIVYNDVVSGQITLSGTSTESQSHSSSPAGTITLSGTVSQSQSHSSSPVGTITFTGSATESAVFGDSPSGTITLSGSVSQSWSTATSVAGTITLSGSLQENFQPPGGAPGISNTLQIDPNHVIYVSMGAR